MSTNLGGWQWITYEGGLWEVLPVDDLREHEHSLECWCRPFIDEDEFGLVHNSMDRREMFEAGETLHA